MITYTDYNKMPCRLSLEIRVYNHWCLQVVQVVVNHRDLLRGPSVIQVTISADNSVTIGLYVYIYSGMTLFVPRMIIEISRSCRSAFRWAHICNSLCRFLPGRRDLQLPFPNMHCHVAFHLYCVVLHVCRGHWETSLLHTRTFPHAEATFRPSQPKDMIYVTSGARDARYGMRHL